jgi:hypothetical protein
MLEALHTKQAVAMTDMLKEQTAQTLGAAQYAVMRLTEYQRIHQGQSLVYSIFLLWKEIHVEVSLRSELENMKSRSNQQRRQIASSAMLLASGGLACASQEKMLAIQAFRTWSQRILQAKKEADMHMQATIMKEQMKASMSRNVWATVCRSLYIKQQHVKMSLLTSWKELTGQAHLQKATDSLRRSMARASKTASENTFQAVNMFVSSQDDTLVCFVVHQWQKLTQAELRQRLQNYHERIQREMQEKNAKLQHEFQDFNKQVQFELKNNCRREVERQEKVEPIG